MNRLVHQIKVVFKWLFIVMGATFFILIVLSFTDIPYNAYHHLGTVNSSLSKEPDLIVVMGGSGMPSPDGLIRTYYAAEFAKQFPTAEIIVALPYNEADSLHQLQLMAHELIVKGVDSLRIKFEPLGYNTRSQAVNVARMNANSLSNKVVLLITSPDHMYRAVRSFKKVGFLTVGGIPAFETPCDEEILKDKSSKHNKLSLRYNMWSYLQYELLVIREYTAIAYYKINGWI